MQFAHGGSIGIVFFVIVQGVLPAIGDAAFTNEHEGIAFPVALHKRIDITGIPVGILAFKNIADDLLVVVLGSCSNAQEYSGDKK